MKPKNREYPILEQVADLTKLLLVAIPFWAGIQRILDFSSYIAVLSGLTLSFLMFNLYYAKRSCIM